MAETTIRSGGQHREVRTQTHIPGEIVAARIVYWGFGVIETILAFRFVLRLLGANPNASFTEFVYRISAGLMSPFFSVFPTQRVEGAVFEWSTLLAVAVYALVGWGIVSLIYAARPREAVSHIEESEHVDSEQRP